jgi:hypothetical protein
MESDGFSKHVPVFLMHISLWNIKQAGAMLLYPFACRFES